MSHITKLWMGGCGQVAYDFLFLHLCVMGDYKLCVVSDDILFERSIFVGSKLPKDMVPTELDLSAREIAAEAATKLVPKNKTRYELKLDSTLTPKQHTLLVKKMVKAYEGNIAGLLSDDAKVKQRPSVSDWVCARIVIQMWDETVAFCAEKDLCKDDFQQLEKIILETMDLDQELLAVRKRWPKWFHMGLLPNLVSDEQPSSDVKLRNLTDAQRQAEVSAFRAFELELQEDWNVITQASEGLSALREYLAWRNNQHRREQAQIGEKLVTAWVSKHFPTIEVASWDRVAGAVSIVRQTLGTGGLQERCNVVVLMDFNCPGARDTLRMTHMIQAAATICNMMGPGNCAVLAWMPNCSKEDSTASAFEDEITISAQFSKVGFRKQLRVRMLLDMPMALASKVSAIDWFVDGRVCFLDDNGSNDGTNVWEVGSELCRTRIVREIPCVPEPSDMVEATSLSADEELNTGMRYMDISEKCAQRGLAASKAQLKALLTPSSRVGKQEWIGNGRIYIFDFHAHVGDRAMASYELRKEWPGLRHVIIGVGTGQHMRSAKYTSTRMSNRVADDWMNGNLVLTEEKTLPSGQLVDEEVRPTEDAPEPTEQELSKIPGALMAHRGISKLEFRVCVAVGNKINIRPEKLAQFSGCSAQVVSNLQNLQDTHMATYMRALTSMMAFGAKPEPVVTILLDARKLPTHPEQAEESETLMEFESLDALRAVSTISAECRATTKTITLLRDDSKRVAYLVCKAEDTVLAAGTPLGGVGGGQILDADEQHVKAVPWDLPSGDQTWVQLENKKGDRNAEEESDAPKFISGTLYAIARQIESKSTKPLKITSFGDLIPVTEAGLQKYTFSSPHDAENHRKLDFVLTPVQKVVKVSHTNFFAPLLNRTNGLGKGPLQLTWRLTHDPVGNILKVQRVHVTVAKRIELKKDKPVRIVWEE